MTRREESWRIATLFVRAWALGLSDFAGTIEDFLKVLLMKVAGAVPVSRRGGNLMKAGNRRITP